MKRNLVVSSLTSLVALSAASAVAQQTAYAPTLEGGMTASIGTFYAAPSADNHHYVTVYSEDANGDINLEAPHYTGTSSDWGFEASLGYVFAGTANGLELTYRGFDSSSNSSVSGGYVKDYNEYEYSQLIGATDKLNYNFNTVDLMISQFLDVGDHVQMRFSGGLSYANIERASSSFIAYIEPDFEYEYSEYATDSEYNGFGPRLAVDGRYEFGNGFGIVGGASLAYFVGDLDSNNQFYTDDANVDEPEQSFNYDDDMDNHAVVNLRGNLGIDFVHYFDNQEKSSLGLELGYLADYYTQAVNNFAYNESNDLDEYIKDSELLDTSFSGPYLLLKGAF